ncbi:Methyltransf_25 domain-containing protein [Candidatus Hydrogenisulfobacillus filiaventi]|uniref:Methyltransf_25 domain-containing protein n=1 Tax=Candidatus Hydrogenisulfobacillus filiaventi TaxID=2707344 RepID=A0A6F8ZDT7_9FIRM|nr:class I SAM-dependent methyltransferase [Bacillota bacterium]CAB1128091.1 Methyltransf_25 domain-containing protein [Candidatus Hydrogenisulfobacillus filiaventi]
MAKGWRWVLGAAAVLGAGFAALRVQGRRRPAPMAAGWERFFLDNPVRRRFFGPDRVLAVLGDVRDGRVGEIGTGVGVILEALARAVGPGGMVYGVDVQPQAVEMTRRRLARRVPEVPVEVAVADATRLPWPDAALDRVVMVAVLGEVPAARRPAVLAEVRRVLRPGGRLIVTEFWPDPHYIPEAALTRFLAEHGFQVRARHGETALVYSLAAEPAGGEPDGQA